MDVKDLLKVAGGLAGAAFLVAMLRVTDEEVYAHRDMRSRLKPGEFRWTVKNRREK